MKKLFKTLAVAAGAATAAYAAYVAYTFKRYGRPDVSGTPDPLFDDFMPEYEVRDHHAIRIATPAHVAFDLARTLRMDRTGLTRFLFMLRSLPARFEGEATPLPSQGLIADCVALGWRVLSEVPGRHIVLGCATKPWHARVAFEPIAPEAFRTFKEPGYVKIAWAIHAESDRPDACTVTVETRVASTDAEARRMFRRYWAFLSPGIKAIRYDMLEGLKREVERQVKKTDAA